MIISRSDTRVCDVIVNDYMNSQKGQVVLILILVMTVALAIGLSVIQRSLSDVATSTKVEQSSRAFSAAEAGLEQAILFDNSISGFDLDENSRVEGVVKNNVPDTGQALEYLPIGKEEIAQVWLADPSTLNQVYNQSTLNVYWGQANITSDKPALEVYVIYSSGGSYLSRKFYLDPDSVRSSQNGFTNINCTNPTINTSLGSNRSFLCKYTLTGLSPTLILLRGRMLYSSASHPLAVAPLGGSSLPVQARLFTSTGSSGGTQRIVQILRLDKVVPFYFDYAIFSVGDIIK